MSRSARWARTQLTYANVMSSIAVFSVLGGGAYAATQLPRNSVGSTQLKSGAVSSKKVRDRSLRSRDLAPGAALGPAFSARRDGPTDMGVETGGPAVRNLAIGLPAGRYAIVAKLVADNNDPQARPATCSLFVAANQPASRGFARLDSATVGLGGEGSRLDQQSVSLLATHRLRSPDSVSINCNAQSRRGQILAKDLRIIAVPVAAVKAGTEAR